MKFLYVYASAEPRYGSFYDESAIIPLDIVKGTGRDVEDIISEVREFLSDYGWHEIAGKHSFTPVRDFTVSVEDTDEEGITSLKMPGGSLIDALSERLELSVDWEELDYAQDKIYAEIESKKKHQIKARHKEQVIINLLKTVELDDSDTIIGLVHQLQKLNN